VEHLKHAARLPRDDRDAVGVTVERFDISSPF